MKLARVRILDKNLQRHNGMYMDIGMDKAIRGEQAGIWEIVTGEAEDYYQDKELRSYKTKKTFKKGLSRKDLFH